MLMNKQEFRDIYYRCLEDAVVKAEQYRKVTLPRTFEIEFHGFGFSGDLIDPEDACEFLYLGDDEFIYLVDLMVKRVTEETTTIFVRVSGHWPRERFEETFNYKEGRGPFKLLG
jgi:hypothetical protein